MSKLNNIHPGEILEEEFLKPMGITAYKLSQAIGVPQTRTSQILKGRRRITADTALRLSNILELQPNFGSVCKTTLTSKKKCK
jgi:addiction module HigA family antidote